MAEGGRAHGKAWIGTSGWHYLHWRGPFYPRDLRPRDFLDAYRRRFGTVEVNNSFYRLPRRQTLEAWAEAVPPGFRFAVKGSRYITHNKKLRDPEPHVAKLFAELEGLGPKLGPVLWQLPPRWRFDPARLEGFLRALPGGVRHAFEFRDPDWLRPACYDLLREYGAALCLFDLAGFANARESTSDFTYIRLHGPGRAYQGSYTDAALDAWARDIRAWLRAGRDVYVYFDNDQAGYAPNDALRLKSRLD